MNSNIKLIIGLILVFVIGIGIYAFAHSRTPSTTEVSTPAQTNPNPAPTVNTSNSSPSATATEDAYKQWLKDDYTRWKQAKDSTEMYSLYLAAKNKVAPDKYQEFHQHYVQSYYYYYQSLEAAENGDMASSDYYRDLAGKEDAICDRLMPDYYQITANS